MYFCRMSDVNKNSLKEKNHASENSDSSRSRHGNLYKYDDSFLEQLKTSRFWLVRGIYFIVASIWTIVMIVGGFIAWLVSWLLL